jgi:uncharacterized protein YndB with AHSA1/START domain
MRPAVQTDWISDDAVQSKTGKTWPEWFKILDRAGARRMNHKAIAVYLREKHRCPAWWNQMVAVGYERARGLREVHQTPRGYQISVSRTMSASAAELFEAWHDEETRRHWLPQKRLTIRKATPHKSLRITWGPGQTTVEVNLYRRGARKTQVTVQHNKLPGSTAVARTKSYWAKALRRLEGVLVPLAAKP